MRKLVMTIALATGVLALTGCGATKIRTVEELKDISAYKTVYVADVTVQSSTSSPEIDQLNSELAADAKKMLNEATAETQKYTVAETVEAAGTNGLIVETEVRVSYGNRALRHFVGFGAGKGTIESILNLKDSATGETKLNLIAESELTGGAYGGGMKGVVEDNIKKLVKAYQKEISK